MSTSPRPAPLDGDYELARLIWPEARRLHRQQLPRLHRQQRRLLRQPRRHFLGRLQGLVRRLAGHRRLAPRGCDLQSICRYSRVFASACGYDGGLNFCPGHAGERVINPQGDAAPWLEPAGHVFVAARKSARCQPFPISACATFLMGLAVFRGFQPQRYVCSSVQLGTQDDKPTSSKRKHTRF
jgi:hypothetical protein